MIDWRRRPRFFRCRCDKCKATLGPITKPIGKPWMARYAANQTKRSAVDTSHSTRDNSGRPEQPRQRPFKGR